MARFVIADISDAKSVLQELRAIVPDVPSVPVQAIILETQAEPGMSTRITGSCRSIAVTPRRNCSPIWTNA